MASLKEQAYDLIKGRVLDGTYKASEFIDEKEVAAEMGTSRTPIREAIISLEIEGYLSIVPKRGILVTPFTAEDAAALFEVRSMIETWVVRSYGMKASEEKLRQERKELLEQFEGDFDIERPYVSMSHSPHKYLLSLCDNSYLKSIINQYEGFCQRPVPHPSVWMSEEERVKNEQENLNGHLAIIDALLEKDTELAAQKMQEHLDFCKESFFAYLMKSVGAAGH